MDTKKLLDMVTADIKANRIAFGRRSSREYVREIFILCRQLCRKLDRD
jgi:hypothetical protein